MARKPAQPRPAMPTPKENSSVSIRKISNGYVVRSSGETKEGRYFEKEVYSQTNPIKPGRK